MRSCEPAADQATRGQRPGDVAPAAWPGAAARRDRYRSRGARRSNSISSTLKPARSTSMVIPTSTPQPRASGLASSKARRVRQRCPDSGARGVQPVSSAIPRRRGATTRPKPPGVAASRASGGQHRDGQIGPAATTGSISGAQFGGRVAQIGVEQQQGPGLGQSVALLEHAERVHGRLDRGGLAPVPLVAHDDRAGAVGVRPGLVTAAVVADEDDVHPGSCRAAVTVATIVSCSSFAGMMHATPRRARRDGRTHRPRLTRRVRIRRSTGVSAALVPANAAVATPNPEDRPLAWSRLIRRARIFSATLVTGTERRGQFSRRATPYLRGVRSRHGSSRDRRSLGGRPAADRHAAPARATS